MLGEWARKWQKSFHVIKCQVDDQIMYLYMPSLCEYIHNTSAEIKIVWIAEKLVCVQINME